MFSASVPGPFISLHRLNLAPSCPVDVAVESPTLKEEVWYFIQTKEV